MATAFERCYVALLAGLWFELERLTAEAGDDDAAGDRGRIELGAEIVLLELALLDTGGDRWRTLRLVTAAERQRLRDLVAALRPLVAQIVDAPAGSRVAAVAHAQNRLFNELRARAAPLARDAPRAG